MLRGRDTFLADVRERLHQARQLTKHYYDTRHCDVEFAVGDWVWLRLLHSPNQSLEPWPKGKLGPHYTGLFQNLERIRHVAYRLLLPEGACLHDVFHVGVLKPFHGDPRTLLPPLPTKWDGCLVLTPACVQRARRHVGSWELLVEWLGLPIDDSTWEPRQDFTEC